MSDIRKMSLWARIVHRIKHGKFYREDRRARKAFKKMEKGIRE